MRFDIIYNGKIKLSISRDNIKQAGDFVKDIKIRTTKIEHTYYNLEGDKI